MVSHVEEDQVTIEYWEDAAFVVGRIVEYPDVVAMGKDVDEMENNLRKAFCEWSKANPPEAVSRNRQ